MHTQLPPSFMSLRAPVVSTRQRQVPPTGHRVKPVLDSSQGVGREALSDSTVVSLRRIIEETLIACAPLLSGQALSADLGTDALRVAGDPVRLAQVLGNLLHNAAKFTPAGGAIHVRAARVGPWAVLSVTDNGAGIRPEHLDSIFTMFWRGCRTSGGPDTGLGIGLALVRKLVELHDGSVECASRGPGLGTTFLVRLPLVGRT